MRLNHTIMNEGISVRTCSAKDIDALVSLGIKTFRETFDEYNTAENMIRYINKSFNRKVLEQEMGQPGTTFFLAFEDWNPVGYAKVKLSENPEELDHTAALELERLYVLKRYHNKRVGYMMMQTCLSHAKKKECSVLWLGVWENNTRAISFYERNGFQRFGERPFTLGDDVQTDWLMKKELA